MKMSGKYGFIKKSKNNEYYVYLFSKKNYIRDCDGVKVSLFYKGAMCFVNEYNK